MTDIRNDCSYKEQTYLLSAVNKLFSKPTEFASIVSRFFYATLLNITLKDLIFSCRIKNVANFDRMKIWKPRNAISKSTLSSYGRLVTSLALLETNSLSITHYNFGNAFNSAILKQECLFCLEQ